MDEAQKSAVRLAWTIGRLDYMKLPLQKRFDADWERAKAVPGNRQFVLKSSAGAVRSRLGSFSSSMNYASGRPVSMRPSSPRLPRALNNISKKLWRIP
jgi:hypothetical protein